MRRLRENAILEAEVDASGKVTVEGHPVGELQGFRFTADLGDGPDAKATRGAAQKALAPEIEKRVIRLNASPNADFTLALDGTMRWQGAPVARLAATDDVLAPKLLLLADDHLSGPSRDKVESRLQRWLTNRIETLLKPLIDLSNAAKSTASEQEGGLSGAARGLAFRLTETMGVLPRSDVAEEVRSIEGPARGALRRLGVRFGEYHIFLPALLKPAPAELATLLYALKHGKQDAPGFGDVPAMLGQGRTSFTPDPTFDAAFFPIGGFRKMGDKAVRLDILERLADLIRPATQWKPDAKGARPPGAFSRGAFFVTPAMLSILGAKMEDMTAILKALGYRHEPKTVVRVREVIEGKAEREPALEAKPATETVAEPVTAETALADGVETVVPEPVQQEQPAEPAKADDAPPSELALPKTEGDEPVESVFIWRRGGPRDRPANRDGAARRGKPEHRGKGKRADGRDNGRDGKAGDRPPRREGKRPDRDRKPAAAQSRPPSKPKPERKIDPDSPFAALAALKDSLKK